LDVSLNTVEPGGGPRRQAGKANRHKLDKRKGLGCELVITRCDTPTVLDLIEEPLDQISGAVQIRAEADRSLRLLLGGILSPNAFLGGMGPDPVGIIRQIRGNGTASSQVAGFVGNLSRLCSSDERLGGSL
jgi:hypothetical protein